MICPSCGKENLAGVDICEFCYSALAGFEITASTPGFLRAKVLEEPIKNVGLREAITLPPSATAHEAIQAMKNQSCGCILVVKGQELAGILTERDILRKLSFPDIRLNEIHIENIMTPVPEVLTEDHLICHALNKMSIGRFRRVPIRRNDGTFTYFSARDALRYLF